MVWEDHVIPEARRRRAEKSARSSSFRCMVRRLSASPNNNSKNTARLKSVAVRRNKKSKKKPFKNSDLVGKTVCKFLFWVSVGSEKSRFGLDVSNSYTLLVFRRMLDCWHGGDRVFTAQCDINLRLSVCYFNRSISKKYMENAPLHNNHYKVEDNNNNFTVH